MPATVRPCTDLDRDLHRACERFAEEVGQLSSDMIMREGVLRAAICAMTKALEGEFDGYQDLMSREFLAQSEMLASLYD